MWGAVWVPWGYFYKESGLWETMPSCCHPHSDIRLKKAKVGKRLKGKIDILQSPVQVCSFIKQRST